MEKRTEGAIPFSQYRYKRGSSPAEVVGKPLEETGINCLTLVWLYLNKILGHSQITADPDFTGKYIKENNKLFADVPLVGPFLEGDIFLFGPEGLTDLNELHTAVFSGERRADKALLLYHATNYSLFLMEEPDTGVFKTALPRMLKQRQWKELYGVRRPISPEPDSP